MKGLFSPFSSDFPSGPPSATLPNTPPPADPVGIEDATAGDQQQRNAGGGEGERRGPSETVAPAEGPEEWLEGLTLEKLMARNEELEGEIREKIERLLGEAEREKAALERDIAALERENAALKREERERR